MAAAEEHVPPGERPPNRPDRGDRGRRGPRRPRSPEAPTSDDGSTTQATRRCRRPRRRAGPRPAFGAGAAAVVAGALGGCRSPAPGWARCSPSETLIGQIKTSQTGTAAQQIQEIYGDSWHTTALVNGVFALLALVVGAVVLARPAFGTPGRAEQPVWVRAVALAGVALGVIGLLISAGMYLDLFAALPSAKG